MKVVCYVMAAILLCVLSSAVYGQSSSSAGQIKLIGRLRRGQVQAEVGTGGLAEK